MSLPITQAGVERRPSNARPQAVGYGQTDSPAGLAGWTLVHPGFMLDNFSLY